MAFHGHCATGHLSQSHPNQTGNLYGRQGNRISMIEMNKMVLSSGARIRDTLHKANCSKTGAEIHFTIVTQTCSRGFPTFPSVVMLQVEQRALPGKRDQILPPTSSVQEGAYIHVHITLPRPCESFEVQSLCARARCLDRSIFFPLSFQHFVVLLTQKAEIGSLRPRNLHALNQEKRSIPSYLFMESVLHLSQRLQVL